MWVCACIICFFVCLSVLEPPALTRGAGLMPGLIRIIDV